MLLTSFLYATGLLANMLGLTLARLDQIVLIDSPQITVLDLFITMVVLARAISFIQFLAGAPQGGKEEDEGVKNMYG